jgi:hypothetical protein
LGGACDARHAAVLGALRPELALIRRNGLAGLSHHGTNCWNALQATVLASYFACVDGYVALNGLSGPVDAPVMRRVAPFLALAQLLSCVAALIGAASIIMGFEALRSRKGARFVLCVRCFLVSQDWLALALAPVLALLVQA